MRRRDSFWKSHWAQQSRLNDDLSASGWGPRSVKEYLYDVDDICKKLQLQREDRFLNIGCGCGLLELVLNYWVKHIDSVDFSEEMIARSKRNNQHNTNVRFHLGNILDLSAIRSRYDKVLVNSVIQYLHELQELRRALDQIKLVSKRPSRILIAANPDVRMMTEYLKGYDGMNMTPGEKKAKINAVKRLLWTHPAQATALAREVGFQATILKMNPNIWQSWYMYDLLLWK